MHGKHTQAQAEADRGYREFLSSSPEWSWKFRILEAEALTRQGLNQRVLDLLESPPAYPDSLRFSIPVFTLKGLAYARLHQFKDADENLNKAEQLCATAPREPTCGAVPRARGVLALEEGHFSGAQEYFEKTLAFARTHGDHYLESTALLNLSAAALQQNHFDDAVDQARSAYRISSLLGSEDVTEVAVGNLGRAYYKLGDLDKALESFTAASRSAERLGRTRGQVIWLTNIGYVHLDRSDYAIAEGCFNEAITLASRIGAKQFMRNALIPLSLAYERQGKLDQAIQYSDQAITSARADGNRLDELYPLLVKGQVAAQLHDSAKAAAIFREVANDPAGDSSLKWEAQDSLARLEEHEGRRDAANREYQAALCTFETARSSLRHEESKLPFFTNASRIYNDYIGFLIGAGQSGRALQVADYSRARTLAEGLGLTQKGDECAPAAINPQAVAAKSGASILYYWLGESASYLWAITPHGTRLFSLPPAKEIDTTVRRYRKALIEGEDVLASSNADGARLYQMLIAPAAPLLGKDTRVIIIPDGSLNGLNFETLLAPGTPHGLRSGQTGEGARPSTNVAHYWIEDAVITNAHSLRLLSQGQMAPRQTPKLLLIGDPLARAPEYAALPNARVEIEEIEKHFAPADVAVYMQSSATPDAFLSSKPEQFSYIHFVAHGVASTQVPLDSAVILSPSPGEDSFKLYARDIIQHPLRARLVTISACYGAGTRAYTGEGLIGLSWAFLRAGAQSTIGALWEVNDASTPQLMDYFYSDLQKGRRPDVALRDAKLALMQSSKALSKPFYWASFQIYGRS